MLPTRVARPPRRPAASAARPAAARWPWLLAGLVALAASFAAYRLANRGPRLPDAGVPPAAHVMAAPPPSPPLPPLPADAAVTANSYIGSAACGECHPKELAGWRRSWHARALAPATGAAVVGDFADAKFTGTSSEATMTRAAGAPMMKTLGPDGVRADYAIAWVIGGKRMQDTVTVFPDGRWQVLPVYFHVADKKWVDYTEAKQGKVTPEHPFWWSNARRMANHECLDCHTTNLRVSHDDASGAWTTTASDFNVACESCHGPGGHHGDTSKPADIIHPTHAGALGVTACARCHGPRQPLWPLLDPEHAFRLGDDYDEAYDPIVVTLPGGGTSSDFFADGRPATSSFEYQAMLQSQCYRKGGATCLTCHTAPHAAGPDGKARHADLRDTPDKLCRGCHESIAPTHSHHTALAAQQCVACHMPPVVSGVLDHFADHAIDVPDLATTAKHGVPNACAVCHADKQPEALAAAVAAWWPAAATRQARRERLADALDETTAAASGPALRAVIADAAEAPTLRGAAGILLARRGHAAAARDLLPLLASELTVLRAKGCEALGAARAPATGDAVAALLADRSLRVRLACALALYDMHDARGEPALAALADAPATAHLLVPHLELGRAAAAREDWGAARRELTTVVQLAPYFTDAIVELAGVDAELGDLTDARRRVASVLAVEPRNRGGLALAAKLDRRPAPPN